MKFLMLLFAIAYADKILHHKEEKMLIEISKIFKISKDDFNRIKNIYNVATMSLPIIKTEKML